MTPLVIVTGLSGAGKSVFLRTLEDMGYETIDNLPLSLLESAVEEKRLSYKPLAIGVDVRSRHFSAERLMYAAHTLKQRGCHATVVFLESDDGVLQSRYRETRRTHPLAGKQTLEEQISAERVLLEDLRTRVDVLVDTSLLSPPELKTFARDRFGFAAQRKLVIHLMSFAFREGIPRESDMLFDMRFLKNPYYQDALKPLTGQNPSIGHYFEKDQVFQDFSQLLRKMLMLTLPLIEKDGRGFFIIGFGCSGGKHRSVFTAEWTAAWLTELGYTVQLYHRELEKTSP